MLFHCFGAGHVFDPEVVEDDVGDLDHFHCVDSFEDCVEKGDLLDYEVDFVDVYSVADIIWVFDEEEDAGAEELLGGGCEDEGERQKGGASCCKGCDEASVLECNYRCC